MTNDKLYDIIYNERGKTMKVKDRVCDICGESVYKHACHQYKISISKRLWEVDSRWLKLDLCENCYKILEKSILKKKNELKGENK